MFWLQALAGLALVVLVAFVVAETGHWDRALTPAGRIVVPAGLAFASWLVWLVVSLAAHWVFGWPLP